MRAAASTISRSARSAAIRSQRFPGQQASHPEIGAEVTDAPGTYVDPVPEPFLPRGLRIASRGQVACAWLLGVLLFSLTLGVGYISWSLCSWGQGRSPAQRMFRLRCWLPESRQVAGRRQMAVRQITGFCLNGQLLSGLFIWLTSKKLRSVGDFFASTVILYDPDRVLPLCSAASPVG